MRDRSAPFKAGAGPQARARSTWRATLCRADAPAVSPTACRRRGAYQTRSISKIRPFHVGDARSRAQPLFFLNTTHELLIVVLRRAGYLPTARVVLREG